MNAKQRLDQNFALLDGSELARECMARFSKHIDRLKRNRRHARMLRSWRMYYAQSKDGSWDTTETKPGGKQGELTIIKPNHYRSVLRKIVQMATTEEPAWDPTASNTDVDSQRATLLARNVLEHYGHEEKLYERIVDWAEACLMLGEGFMCAPWNANTGAQRGVKDVPVYGADGKPEQEQTGVDDAGEAVVTTKTMKRLTYEGDFDFTLHTPWSCAIEAYSNNRDKPNWGIFRTPINRYDAMVIWPAQAEAIMSAPSRSEVMKGIDLLPTGEDDEDDDAIFIYHFYYRRTPSVPNGRQALFLDDETLLGEAQALAYRDIPIFRCAPADVLLQDGGYTDAFDIQAICDAIGSQLSTLLSNNAALGVQRFIADRGANVEVQEIAKNLGVIYKNKGFEFRTADFNVSPAEAYAFLQVLMKQLDLLGNVNAVQRGDVEAAKGDSGSKSALLLSASQQAQSGFQKSLRAAYELLGSHIVETLQTHASTERIVAIAGRANASTVAKFKGDDLKPVRRVRVKKGSPLLQTLEGRLEIANLFKDLINDPEKLWEMLNSGRFDVLGEPDIAELNLIRQENEQLESGEGEPVIVAPFDRHAQHIQHHRCVAASPAARLDPNIVKRQRDHVMAHIRALIELPPPVLAAIGEQSLAPQMPPGTGPVKAPGGGAPPDGQQSGAGNGKAPKKPMSKAKQGGQPVDGARQPRMPRGPKNPSTGEQMPVTNPPPPQV